MPQLIYILFLLIVINFYLKLRKHNLLSGTDKFMISLMSIFILFFLYYGTAYVLGDKYMKMMGSTLNIVFTLTMVLVMPVISTEIVLAIYDRLVANRK